MPTNRKTKRFTILLASLLWCGALISPAQAAVINAAGCSQADVQAAINSASSGDIVAIPAGTCTWTNGITLSKRITLQGNGVGSTIITYSGGTLFLTSGESANNFRVMTSGRAGGLSFAGPSKGPDRKRKNNLDITQTKGNASGSRFSETVFRLLRITSTSYSRRCQTLGVPRQSRGFT